METQTESQAKVEESESEYFFCFSIKGDFNSMCKSGNGEKKQTMKQCIE